MSAFSGIPFFEELECFWIRGGVPLNDGAHELNGQAIECTWARPPEMGEYVEEGGFT